MLGTPTGPLIVGNNAAFGGGPIQTYDFGTGSLVNSFVPDGATSGPSNNGRAVAVAGNKVFYSELSGSGFGPSDAIHIAPFNGGVGGSDIGTLPNPAPSVGIQDLDYANGALYALTGYPSGSLQVWKLDPTTGAVLAGPIAINSDPSADGFTVLPDGDFLINSSDASCTYAEYNSSTGAPTGASITVPGAGQCTGVATDGTSLYFETDFDSFTQTDLTGNLIARTSVASNLVEDVSLVTGPAIGPPQDVQVTPANGSVSVTWKPPATGAGSVTGYVVTATPTYNDRLPAPQAGPVSKTVGSSALSVTVPGLVEDCHQMYVVSVAAQGAAGTGLPATSGPFRPSGLVVSGTAPYEVVILLDGINESKPGFTMDPYKPTLDNVPSYCPESWNSSTSTEGEADFNGAPNGPWEFFDKWNFQDSTPQALPNNASGLPQQTLTHSFMLDAIAAQGSIILPFSYNGATLKPGTPDPTFSFKGYSNCDSTPGCGKSINADALLLNKEITSITAVWPDVPIVVMGHSQGGLIAFTWWNKYPLPRLFDAGFSLDSPINGACLKVVFACLGPPTYPKYSDRQKNDPQWLAADAAQGDSFQFIGTYGDSPAGGYQSGAETLQHQLLFDYNTYSSDQINQLCANPFSENSCPAPAPPDHISECPVGYPGEPSWESSIDHFVEKFCPGDVTYVNNVLGLSY